MSPECRGKPYFEEKVCELRNYKFVLGIENTIKDDYVTESTPPFSPFWDSLVSPVYTAFVALCVCVCTFKS